MKKIYLILLGVTACVSYLSSCRKVTDYLDKAPGIDVTEDTIFSSKVQVETAVAGAYRYGIHSVLGYADGDVTNAAETLHAGATDEAETGADWYYTNWAWNEASVNPSRIDDRRFNIRWQAIRRVNTLLEKIDDVPGTDQTYRDQVRGEVMFIRALNYFEMLKRYGGVPIVKTRFGLEDDLKVPRSTLQEVIDFIVSDCNEAIQLLPASVAANMRGRATKGVALILKSRTLLYAASPQFNSSNPVVDFGENNKLISYGNADPSRWKLAADAAKAVIDWAPQGGVRLINELGVNNNYQYVWEKYDNAEIILAEKAHGNIGKWTWPWSAIAPPSVYPGNAGQSGISVTLNFVKMYEKKDGTPQTWSETGGNDLNQKYAELDPRFAQTVAYNGSRWNNEFPELQIWQGGRNEWSCDGGAWLHKLYPAEISERTWQYVPNSTLFRLAEAYLNYAEALNEAEGPVAAAYDAVNIVRERSGMPALPPGLSKEQFRARIRNERAIELAFEDHRFWDIRRWQIAENEGVMKGKMYGIKIYKINGSTDFRYEPYVFEERSFTKRMYLHPFPQNEVNKGYLIQNPGW